MKPIPPHYRTLGVLPNASEEEIKKAYRRLAKQYHPDRNIDDPRAEDLFKRITLAYKILGNPISRRDYDFAHNIRADEWSSQGEDVKRPVKGGDIRLNLKLTLEESVRGGSKQVRYSRFTLCLVCRGNGKTQSELGFCSACDGNGIVQVEHTVKVSYPSGVRHGSTLIIAGGGHMSRSGKISDLKVTISIKPHPYFSLNGDNLVYRLLIGLDKYIEGGKVKVPTLGGSAEIVLKPRLSGGAIFRLKGRGLPSITNGPPGDLIVAAEPCLPKVLSRKERLALENLMLLHGFHPPVDENGFIPRGEDEEVCI